MKKIYNLTEGSILKKLILVALPILATTLSQMLYNLTDMFWIGRVYKIGLDGTKAVSAVGTALYLTWFAFGIILISKIGTSVKVSHAVGANKPHQISVYASNGLLMQLFFGLGLAALVLIFKNQFIAIFGISDETIKLFASQYITIVGGLIFIQFMVNGFISINEGLGKTSSNLMVLAIGFVVNMILDPLFILVFKFGVQGAAIATVFAQFITLTIFFLIYKTQNPNLKVFHLENLNWEAVKRIITIGLPVGIQSMFFTIISIYIARRVFLLDFHLVAAQRIGVQVEQLTWMIAGGFQTAITVFVGQNFGAKLYGRIRRGAIYISLLLIPYSILISAMIYTQAGNIMKLFFSDNSLDYQMTIDYGIEYLKIVYIGQIFMMIEGIGTGIFNGLGKTRVPSVNSIVGNSLRIPLVIVLSSLYLQRGIWWAINISSILKGVVMLIAVIVMYNKLKNLKHKKAIKITEGVFASD